MMNRSGLAAALALALAAYSCGDTEARIEDSAGASDTEGPLPAFSLPSLEGDVVSNGDIEGKVALVNFWAT